MRPKMMRSCFRFRTLSQIAVSISLIHVWIPLVNAQNVAVSATAAWSSQIVAFWGAILIGVRSCVRGHVVNAVSSISCSIRVARRAAEISKALQDGDWVLHSGWKNGTPRTDVAVVCWRSQKDLRALALRVAMQTESFGDAWEVLIVGRELKGSSGQKSSAHWIKSPRCEDLSPCKVKATAENMFPLSADDIAEGMVMLKQTPKVQPDEIAQALYSKLDTRASRCTGFAEMQREVGFTNPLPSFAYHFTNVENHETPYLSLSHETGQLGSSRSSKMVSAFRMYFLVHIMVAAAVGLMGAAAGRGLAVWLMAIRPTLQTLGADGVSGSDSILTLISMDQSFFQYETDAGSSLLAGEIISTGLRWWHLGAALAIPVLELLLIGSGWLYGALRVERIQPSGVVGHGMLWLSVVVGLGLSLRAMTSIRKRLGGRLVGLFRTPHYDHIIVGVRFQRISIDRILQSNIYSDSVLGLAAILLRDCTPGEESTAILVAEAVLRSPGMSNLLALYLINDIQQYQYEGDNIVLKGDPPIPVTVRGNYPWVQTGCCIILTMICGCVSVVYAYTRLPSWVKIVTEVLLAISAVWFSTLERFAGLTHNRDTYVCFMVATLVISSVWYVGVTDVG